MKKVMMMSPFSSSCIFHGLAILVLICLFHPSKAVLKLPPNVTVPALIVFGDSIMDTGNNNNLKTVVKCDFPPYGQDFAGRKPTGRFGNGKVPSDLIVEELGIKEYLPAYLDPNLNPKDLATGVCFASGGSGFDPMTPQIVSVLSFSDQLRLFEEYLGKLKANVGKRRTKFILENSIFLVVAGSDDIANTYFTVRLRKLQYDVPAYTDLMLNSASDFVKQLYGLGARRIGLFSTPPIGCVPSQRTLGGGLLRDCAEEYNEAALLFNSKLSATLDSLKPQLPNGRLVYIDIYNPLLDLIVNHKKYGFDYVDKGCCGTGAIEVAILCNPLSPPCENPAGHIFWDSYHPSDAAYKFLVPTLLKKYVNGFI
ncbi:GDSL esterase/lipase EXL3 [Morus notabilis]|uniref:GDSL esterase/lipase EXL3 n=1 Tax=Morus notabilis TaxID=981085 RepID=W9RZ22_9ROSA|nr:GDSL esterase/lipase EXL3 [Morus notabilis]EXC04219.1 GDSL esterase/lipase EXL3 [Morus notabilis]